MAFTKFALEAFGCSTKESEIVAEHLITANLSGHDSHGVGMLPMYGAQVKDGNLIPNQTPELMPPNGAITVVDAKKGFGHHMTLLALDHAMKTIPDHKVALLGLRNSGHISRVGTYSEYCAERGFVSIHFVNVVGHDPIVAPFGARAPGFSTNPISMAIPKGNDIGPLLDMATSTVAFGKLRVASNKGENVPEGWVVDEQGLPTIDPDPMVNSKTGALSAFGNHKGSGLGIFAELLAGALAGTNTVNEAEIFDNGVLNNMLSIIIDPSGFDDPSAITERVQSYESFIAALNPAKGQERVLLPGDPEIALRTERSQSGIDVDDETIRQIAETVHSFDVSKEVLLGFLPKN